MRTLFMVLMIAGLMSTVGVYAAGLGGSPTIKAIGGTGAVTVFGPTDSATSIVWNYSGGQVTGAVVTWTPNVTGNFDISLTAGGQTGSLTSEAGVSGTPENNTVTFGTPAEADLVTDVKLIITEN